MNLEDLTPVLFPDADFEFELFTEWTAGLLISCLLVAGVVFSYFLALLGFFTYGFLNKAPVDVAFIRVGFYFFLD